jgi:hypothetical protein
MLHPPTVGIIHAARQDQNIKKVSEEQKDMYEDFKEFLRSKIEA